MLSYLCTNVQLTVNISVTISAQQENKQQYFRLSEMKHLFFSYYEHKAFLTKNQNVCLNIKNQKELPLLPLLLSDKQVSTDFQTKPEIVTEIVITLC